MLAEDAKKLKQSKGIEIAPIAPPNEDDREGEIIKIKPAPKRAPKVPKIRFRRKKKK